MIIQSDYEDALSSGEELQKLCTSLKDHIITNSKMQREKKKISKILTSRERMSQYQRESSSEHSSLEKLRELINQLITDKVDQLLESGEMRSRRGTGVNKRRTNSDSDHSDWRVLNMAVRDNR